MHLTRSGIYAYNVLCRKNSFRDYEVLYKHWRRKQIEIGGGGGVDL